MGFSLKKLVSPVLTAAGTAVGAYFGGPMGASLGASLGGMVGGAVSGKSDEQKAIEANNAEAKRQFDENVALQREFAQNGIRWKVSDTVAAGLHPLAAIGATGASYTPVTTASYSAATGKDNTMSGLELGSQFGQMVSRGMEAKMTRQERQMEYAQRATQLMMQQQQGVDNHDLTRAQIGLIEAQTLNALEAHSRYQPPAMPSTFGNKMPGQGDSGDKYVDSAINLYGLTRDDQGRIVGFVPSDALKQRAEDTLIIEDLPWIGAFYQGAKAKMLGSRAPGGYYWNEHVGTFQKETPPYSSRPFLYRMFNRPYSTKGPEFRGKLR